MKRNCGLLLLSGIVLSIGLGLIAVGFSFLFVDVFPNCDDDDGTGSNNYKLIFDDELMTVSIQN